MDIDIVEEITTLARDLGGLMVAYSACGDDSESASLLRMCAAKAEHAAGLFRELADALDRGLSRVF